MVEDEINIPRPYGRGIKSLEDRSMEIPQKYQDFCRAVGRLAREHGLSDFYGKFSPPTLATDWHNIIEFTWTQGRHGVDAANISITSQVWLSSKIDEIPREEVAHSSPT